MVQFQNGHHGGGDDVIKTDLPLVRLTVLGAAAFFSVVTEVLPAGVLPAMAADFAVTESRVGLLTAVYAGVIVVTVLPLMWATARWSRRSVFLLAIALIAASNVALALSPAFSVALAVRCVGGAGHGMLWALVAPYIGRLVSADRTGAAMAVVLGMASSAIVIGVPAGTLLGEALGWRWAFAAVGALLLAVALATALALPARMSEEKAPSMSIGGALRRPGVLALNIAFPAIFVAHFGLLTYIRPLLDAGGVGPETLSLLLSIMGVAQIAGVWAASRTSAAGLRNALPAGLAVLTLAQLGMAVVGFPLVVVLVVMVLWGAAFNGTLVYFQAASLRVAGPDADAVSTLLAMTIQGGIAVGAVYGGAALELAGIRGVPIAAGLSLLVTLGWLARAYGAAVQPAPAVSDREAALAAS